MICRHIQEFLALVEQGLGKDPDMIVDVVEYARLRQIDPRTAYRHLRHYRKAAREMKDRKVDVRVKTPPVCGRTFGNAPRGCWGVTDAASD